jgi:uncharacterized protein (DUF1330 family)
MPCFMIIQAQITDAARFGQYTRVVPALVAQHGGIYRVLGGATTVLEGHWPEVKTVVSEWPSREAALAFWNSQAYIEATKLRAGAGTFTVVLIDGVPPAGQ